MPPASFQQGSNSRDGGQKQRRTLGGRAAGKGDPSKKEDFSVASCKKTPWDINENHRLEERRQILLKLSPTKKKSLRWYERMRGQTMVANKVQRRGQKSVHQRRERGDGGFPSIGQEKKGQVRGLWASIPGAWGGKSNKQLDLKNNATSVTTLSGQSQNGGKKKVLGPPPGRPKKKKKKRRWGT